MKAQVRSGQTYLWKKIRKESKQQIKQASVISEESHNQKKTLNISKLLPQVQNRKQDTKELDDFINQIQKSGIPVQYYNEAQSDIEIQTSSYIQHQKYPFNSKQNTQQIMAQSIIQKYGIDEELRNDFLSLQNPLFQSNKISPSVSFKIQREMIKVRKVVSILLGQLKIISSDLQNQKKKFKQNLQKIQIEIKSKFIQKIQQQRRGDKNRELQRENVKNRVEMLENEIKSKQQKIQSLNKEIQNLRTQNFQLAFDLNQRIQQADLLIEEKLNKLMSQRIKKANESTDKIPLAVQDLKLSKIQQKSKGKMIDGQPIEQIERRYQKHFSDRYKVVDEDESKSNINKKLFKQYGQLKSKNSLQNTNNNISKNEDEINKKIEEIRKKYRTSKPKTPTVEANAYKNSYDLMQNKSQVFIPQSNNYNSSSNINSYEILNNNSAKNVMKKVSSPRAQGMVIKGFNHSNDILSNLLTKNPQKSFEFRDPKQTKGNIGLQSYKIDRLGNRIDELRNQIKKQIQASR